MVLPTLCRLDERLCMNNRDKILQAACELFYRNGYLATSIDDILDEVHVSKSNFYYHFKTKEDLGIAVVTMRKEEFFHILAETLCKSGASPRERLHLFFSWMQECQASRQRKHGCPFGNLVIEVADHNERLRCKLSEIFFSFTARLAELIAEGQDRGEFRRDLDPVAAAGLVVQTIQGMYLMSRCQQSAETIHNSVQLLLHLLESTPEPSGRN
jgi:TetR/AcrR family transcriptional repressor of nem operon